MGCGGATHATAGSLGARAAAGGRERAGRDPV